MSLEGAVLPQEKNISQVIESTLSAIGLGGQNHLDLPHASQAVVILADGLGYHNLNERIGHTSTLRRMKPRSISTVVPSTTVAGLSAFTTGQFPGQTAMGGYSLRDPESHAVFNLIQWEAPVSPQSWQRCPNLFTPEMVSVQMGRYHDSPLSKAIMDGVKMVKPLALSDRIRATLAELRRGTKFTYLYWSDIDVIGHRAGWTSAQWTMMLEDFDNALTELMQSITPDTLVVVTADHGMIDVTERIDIAQVAQLYQDVDAVAGESRAVHLYTDQPWAVAARWRDYLGPKAWVVTQEEAEGAGLFGPMTDFSRSAFGSVLAFARENLAIVDSRYQSPRAIALKGVHGSLTRYEMEVPLAVIKS